MLDSEIYFFMR